MGYSILPYSNDVHYLEPDKSNIQSRGGSEGEGGERERERETDRQTEMEVGA